MESDTSPFSHGKAWLLRAISSYPFDLHTADGACDLSRGGSFFTCTDFGDGSYRLALLRAGKCHYVSRSILKKGIYNAKKTEKSKAAG